VNLYLEFLERYSKLKTDLETKEASCFLNFAKLVTKTDQRISSQAGLVAHKNRSKDLQVEDQRI
jgi:hypothetical protein